MIRTRIVPAGLSYAERRVACQGQREAAKAWNLCTEWSHEAWRADGNLSAYDLKKRLVALDGDERPKLHTHSIQECAFDFRDAVKTTLENRKQGRDQRMPHREKRFRPVSFTRNFGWYITDHGGKPKLALSFGKGRQRLLVAVPDVPGRWGEIKLCFNGSGYELHIATELPDDEPRPATGRAGAIDPGIVHSHACVAEGEDGKLHTLIISGRETRSAKRLRNKKVAELARKQSRCKRGSRRYRKLQRAKARVMGKADRRLRDLDHKASRKVADFFNEREVDVVYLGDVRGIEKRTRKERRVGRIQRQQLSQWSRGRTDRYLREKTRAHVEYTREDHTSQTCPACLRRHRPKGRIYRCQCGFEWPRDGVGALNIGSRGRSPDTAIAQTDTDRLRPVTYRQPTRVRHRRRRAGDGVEARDQAARLSGLSRRRPEASGPDAATAAPESGLLVPALRAAA